MGALSFCGGYNGADLHQTITAVIIRSRHEFDAELLFRNLLLGYGLRDVVVTWGGVGAVEPGGAVERRRRVDEPISFWYN